MKKISTLLLTAATIVAAVASCNKNNPVAEPASSEPAKGLLSITIGMDEASTKAAFNEMKDSQINKVQVFVFDAANLLETSYYADLTGVSGATSVEIATFTGNKTVYAVLNHPRITSMKPKVSTLANFEAILSDLADNTPTNLIMSGKNVVNVAEYGANGSLATAAPTALQIYVKRLAAAVILKKVTVDFRGTQLEGGSFQIKETYLKNVYGRCPLGVSGNTATANSAILPNLVSDDQQSTAAYWYNPMTVAAGAPACVSDASAYDCTTAGAGTDMPNGGRILFAYPNKTTADNNDDAFSPRHTRLVIKANIKGSAYVSPAVDEDVYYVLDLPVLQANHKYIITNFKVTMPGKSNDDNDSAVNSEIGRILPTITVDPWAPETELSYSF